MSTYIGRLIEYNSWANRGLLDFLDNQPVELHGCEHRAHVGTILGSNGIEPPDLDSRAHGILVHGDDWPPDWGPEPAERAQSWGLG